MRQPASVSSSCLQGDFLRPQWTSKGITGSTPLPQGVFSFDKNRPFLCEYGVCRWDRHPYHRLTDDQDDWSSLRQSSRTVKHWSGPGIIDEEEGKLPINNTVVRTSQTFSTRGLDCKVAPLVWYTFCLFTCMSQSPQPFHTTSFYLNPVLCFSVLPHACLDPP